MICGQRMPFRCSYSLQSSVWMTGVCKRRAAPHLLAGNMPRCLLNGYREHVPFSSGNRAAGSACHALPRGRSVDLNLKMPFYVRWEGSRVLQGPFGACLHVIGLGGLVPSCFPFLLPFASSQGASAL